MSREYADNEENEMSKNETGVSKKWTDRNV